MDKFLEKVGAALDSLNASTLWSYIKNVLDKIGALLGFYGEDEAGNIISIIKDGKTLDAE